MSDSPTSQTGILLVNLGSPTSPEPRSVAKYLREFLSDPSVIDIPGPLRWALVNLIIAPTRSAKSAAAYKKVWTPKGSPLIVNSFATRDALAERLNRHPLDIGMRYGKPSIAAALERLKTRGCKRIVCLPLYPHIAESSTGTAIRAVHAAAEEQGGLEIVMLPEYFDHPAWIEAMRVTAAPQLESVSPDHTLFSFHGLPERHIKKADPYGTCLASPTCCDTMTETNKRCYKAQCLHSARTLASELKLAEGSWSVSFQSRLGRTPWIEPNTEEVFVELAKSGVRKLAVLTPGFSADCLETLEELHIRGVEIFTEAGGEDLYVVPCLNAEPAWIEALASILEPHLSEQNTEAAPASSTA
jgi:ferrochelatase